MSSYGKFAYVYDELMADMPYSDWLAFAEGAWQKYGKPVTVAELGCGTGSITIPLAAAGYHMTGIDLSSDMLSVAQRKMEEQPQGRRFMREGSVRWIRQNMTEWELPEPVDSVISFCDCLNYLLEEKDIQAAFARTYAGLKPGGVFLFDVHHPNTLIRYEEEQPFILDEPSVSYIWTCQMDVPRREIEHHLSIFARDEGQGGLYRRFEETHIQRAYEPEWLAEELRKAGFSEVLIYADFEWMEAGEDAERLFYVAVK
ncbi:class I SAM-dependent methyltransferase [Paenibacillus albidus]|uniref:class I SAM-dependent DNA methyltransferase n=1 Tax=Paenibacillus albidus TaxID=2041023 RepID=UPI001BED1273|nr:class I SAM-dependent methyltransferase [Paenibacillus albidus]MBT2288760.1 class I SAM-dependent methyltransferase [Paenibacillus albidus]